VSQVVVAEPTGRKRVLFADEEIGALHDLQRMLQPMRREWEMIFATSGTMALQILEERPFDVLVTAARLSDLADGSLLAAVAVQHPQMIRIALCDRADREALVRTAGLAHQQLSKPADPALITSQIRRTLALQHLLTDSALQTVVAQIGTLPTLPSLYLELQAELKSDEPSPERVARIISADPAMNAKIIQMANSPFWGLRTTITQPREAVLFLGLATVSALVLSIHVFSCFDARRLASCKLADFWAHSTMVSGYTRGIARVERCDPTLVGEATIAGLLHDLGKLVTGELTARLLPGSHESRGGREAAAVASRAKSDRRQPRRDRRLPAGPVGPAPARGGGRGLAPSTVGQPRADRQDDRHGPRRQRHRASTARPEQPHRHRRAEPGLVAHRLELPSSNWISPTTSTTGSRSAGKTRKSVERVGW